MKLLAKMHARSPQTTKQSQLMAHIELVPGHLTCELPYYRWLVRLAFSSSVAALYVVKLSVWVHTTFMRGHTKRCAPATQTGIVKELVQKQEELAPVLFASSSCAPTLPPVRCRGHCRRKVIMSQRQFTIDQLYYV